MEEIKKQETTEPETTEPEKVTDNSASGNITENDLELYNKLVEQNTELTEQIKLLQEANLTLINQLTVTHPTKTAEELMNDMF